MSFQCKQGRPKRKPIKIVVVQKTKQESCLKTAKNVTLTAAIYKGKNKVEIPSQKF